MLINVDFYTLLWMGVYATTIYHKRTTVLWISRFYQLQINSMSNKMSDFVKLDSVVYFLKRFSKLTVSETHATYSLNMTIVKN